MARTSSRSNQRASAISSGSMRDLLAQRLGQQPHHQGRWKRPGLRGEIAHPPDANARFLEDLAPHRLLDRLARLHESGEAGEPGADPPPTAAEQAALALDREHDHDRVDARIMVRPAIRAAPPPSGRVDRARRPALRAKAVPRVPVEQRARLGEDRGLAAGDRGGQGCGHRRSRPAPARPPARRWHRARNGHGRRRSRAGSAWRRASIASRQGATGCQSSSSGRAVADQRLQLAQRQQPGCRIVEQRSDPAGILPALADAVERVARKGVDLFHRRRPIPRSPSPEHPAARSYHNFGRGPKRLRRPAGGRACYPAAHDKRTLHRRDRRTGRRPGARQHALGADGRRCAAAPASSPMPRM